MNPSLLIAITLPDRAEGETRIIDQLIKGGIDYVHVRKPGWSSDEVEAWIEEIPREFHSQLTIHYHHQLTEKLGIGGVHHSNGFPLERGYKLRTSRSCHSIKEMAENCHDYDYMFLSPIFESISKEGYGPSIKGDELIRVLKHPACDTNKVVALGGVSIDTITQARQMGFSSIALLGGLWVKDDNGEVNSKETLNNLKQIKELWSS